MNLKRLTLTNEDPRDSIRLSVVYRTPTGLEEKQDGTLKTRDRRARDEATVHLLERAIEGIRGGEYEEVMHGKGEALRWEQLALVIGASL